MRRNINKLIREIYCDMINFYFTHGMIKEIPKLSITKATTYAGRIYIFINNDGTLGECRDIKISSIAHSNGCVFLKTKLIDTIAHEIAHLIETEHGKEHDNLTKKFMEEYLEYKKKAA